MSEQYEKYEKQYGEEYFVSLAEEPMKVQRLCWESDFLHQAIKRWHRRVKYLPDHQKGKVREYVNFSAGVCSQPDKWDLPWDDE